MTTTPILGITEIEATQLNKHVAWNAAIAALEKSTQAISPLINLAASNYTLTDAEFVGSCFFRTINNNTTRTITVPATKRLFYVENGGGQPVTIQISGGGSKIVQAGNVVVLHSDGSVLRDLTLSTTYSYSFLSLDQTPDSYVGLRNTRAKIKGDESGLELVNDGGTPPAAIDFTTEFSTTSPVGPVAGMTAFCRELPTHHLAAIADGQSPDTYERLLATQGLGLIWPEVNSTSEFQSFGLAFTQSGETNAVTYPTGSGTYFLENRYASLWTSTSAGATAYLNASAAFAVGTAPAIGGFEIAIKFGLEVLDTTSRAFVGLHSSTGFLTTHSDITTAAGACIGIYRASGDATWSIIQKKTGATAVTTPLSADFPANTAATDVFELRLYCPPGGTPEYTLRRLGTAFTANGTYTGGDNLPLAAEAVAPTAWMSNGSSTTQCKIGVFGVSAMKPDLPANAGIIAAVGLGSSSVVGTFTIETVDKDIRPSGLTSTVAFGATAVVSNQDVTPASYANTTVFGGLFTGNEQIVQPDDIAGAAAFGTLELQENFQRIYIDDIDNIEAFGVVTINRTVSPNSIAPTSAIGAQALIYEQFIAATGIGNVSVFGTQDVFGYEDVTPTSYVNTSAFGTLNISLSGAVTSVDYYVFGRPWVALNPSSADEQDIGAFGAPWQFTFI